MQKLSRLLFLTLFITVCTAFDFDKAGNISVVERSFSFGIHDTNPLSDGNVYRLTIENTGIIKIPFEWLAENLPIDVSTIDPQQIQLFGHGGGSLPELNSTERSRFLNEQAIYVSGEDDGRFDNNDYILFYAENQDDWILNEETKRFEFRKNIYDRANYYFLKINHENGKRVQSESLVSPTQTQSLFISHQIYHEDEVNLLADFPSTHGSGQRWFGEELSNISSFNLLQNFDWNHMPSQATLTLKAELAVRSNQSEEVVLKLDNNEFTRKSNPVNIGDVEAIFARNIEYSETVISENPPLSFQVEFNKNAGAAQLWMDYVQLQVDKQIVLDQDQLVFNNLKMQPGLHDGLSIQSSAESIKVWDITDHSTVFEKRIEGDETNLIASDASSVKRYIAFDESMIQNRPTQIVAVAPQDLSNLFSSDLIIIYHPEFQFEAERLAAHRRSHSGLTVNAVDINHIFNEYSSGKQDPTAIRDFARFQYLKDPAFRYLLLFGDASYDFRGLSAGLSYENFIPTYETAESLDPLEAFPSDDYFGLLDDDEGGTLRGDLDISIGRITARSKLEAKNVVDKIINYDLSPATLGNWRMNIAFLADDEDNNLHLNDADRIARRVASIHPEFNIDKIYWDAFKQESTPGGNRYPEANSKLNAEIDQGLLVMNYLGHGGPRGWSQERVLNLDDIDSWSNINRLPLIITATCSFTSYDDASLTSAGESALLSPSGGAVALFTTVRSVYASKNFRLTQSVFNEIFTKSGNRYLTLGEILQYAKNDNRGDDINARKFLLMGDPSMNLSIPEALVRTTSINGAPIQDLPFIDTVGALDRVRVAGEITDLTGQIKDDFDGSVTITVFDKANEARTLKNDPGSFERSFSIQNNVIFSGEASVVDGKFDFEFVVPLDINYTPGNAKISYYALSNQGMDAGGASENLVIGGSGRQGLIDDQGPDVEIKLNDPTFESGDLVGPHPFVFVDLSDDIGLNLSTASIGHEITAILDDNSQSTIILNSLFIPEIDNFARGKITFQLEDLEEGPHSLTIKAFDTANNPGETTVEFVVEKGLSLRIHDVTASPNPLSNFTQFSLRHELSSNVLQVELSIYDIQGRLVETVEQTVTSENGMVDDIVWRKGGIGLDITPGVYLYSIKLTGMNNEERTYSDLKKLVILK